jgi:hypothetical protein
MANLDHILRAVVAPGLALLPSRMDSDEARAMLLAIGLQESRLTYRRQIGGPAVGLWQFELGGGVVGVLEHDASAALAAGVCDARGVRPTPAAVYRALPIDDLLACAFARLLLFTDSKPLPSLDAPAEQAWAYYLRNWRPGKPHRETWDDFHAQAVAAVRARPSFEGVISRVSSTEETR